MCDVALMVAVPIPACIACVTAESPARLVIDVGFVFVSASCVFSMGISCGIPFNSTLTVGIFDCAGGSGDVGSGGGEPPDAAAVAGDAAGGVPTAAGDVAVAGAVPDAAAMIASISVCVTPAFSNAIRPSGETSNFDLRVWMVVTIMVSGTPA